MFRVLVKMISEFFWVIWMFKVLVKMIFEFFFFELYGCLKF